MERKPDEIERDMDEELVADFLDEDPAIYQAPRFDGQFDDFIGQDGGLHAKVM